MPNSVLSALKVLLLVLVLLLNVNVASAAYRWIDESGSVHFVQYEYQVPEAFRETGRYEEVGIPTPSKRRFELQSSAQTADAAYSSSWFSSTIMEFLNPRNAEAPHRRYGFVEAAWKWASYHVLGRLPAPEDLVRGLAQFKTLKAEIEASIAGHRMEIAGLQAQKREIKARYFAAVRRMEMSHTDIRKNADTWNRGQDLKRGIAQLNASIEEQMKSIQELEEDKRELERRGARLLVPARPFAILAGGALLLVLAGVIGGWRSGLFEARRVPLPRLLLALLALYLAFVLKAVAGYGALPGLSSLYWVESVATLAAFLAGRIAVSHLGSGSRVTVPTILAALAALAVTVAHALIGVPLTTSFLVLIVWAPTWALATGAILENGGSGAQTFLFGLLAYAGASVVAQAAALSVIAGGAAGLLGIILLRLPDIGSIAIAIVITGLLLWVCNGIAPVAPRPAELLSDGDRT